MVHLLEGDAGDRTVDIDLYDLDASSTENSPRGRSRADGVKAGAHDDAAGKSKKHDASGDGLGLAPSGVGNTFAMADAEKSQARQQQQSHHHQRHSSTRDFPREHDVVVELSSGTTVRPSPDLHTLQLRMAGKVQPPQHADSPASPPTPEQKRADPNDDGIVAVEEGSCVEENAVGMGETGIGGRAERAVSEGDDEKLVRMGVMTAVAIGIHNFPEGLATFVAALSDPSVGLALAVAIAIHNIPEGLCVAIPVYYATGNRWKAFGWALLSGISEPIGAGLGWLILKDIMSELVYGILFGVVAGMMVNITLHELIPTAVRYDPADKVTTNSIIVGMAIMALSLILFLY